MKFLCDNCKAKYQISDEKIAGRTLKMKCRKCGHDIIIRGDSVGVAAPAAKAAPPPSPRAQAAGRAPAAPPPKPAAAAMRAGRATSSAHAPAAPRQAGPLGADFRRQVAAPEPTEPEAMLFDQWHVAIHDVPVGPVKRAELARKIATGAVHAESLVWREGFDDWRPLGQVPELTDLLGHARSSLQPGRSGSARPSGGLGASVAPVGGRLGAAPSPAVERASVSSGMLRASTPPPSAPEPSASVSTTGETFGRAKSGLPVGAWIAIAGAIAFGVALAVLLADKMLFEGKGEAVASAATTQAQAAGAPDDKQAEPDMVLDEKDLAAAEKAEDEPTGEGAGAKSAAGRKPAAHRTGAAGSSKGHSGKQLTAAQRKMLERFSGEGAAPTNIETGSLGGSSHGSSGPGLNARQLTSVVGKNRPELQRCYETAIRGIGDPPTVRMDVDVTVGMSGTVTRVRARGTDVGNLANCIERSVRRWRFPSSGNETQTSFPVVFQPGA